ncbi:MAG: lamin tail domain-containing protein [bacterium]
MKKPLLTLIVLMSVIVLTALPVRAGVKSVLITEVQTGSLTSAGEEFVEIQNTTAADIDISGWTLYYKSATGTTWSKKATVPTGLLAAGKFWVFASNLAGNTSYSSGLSQTGGNIQIRDKQAATVDQFGWGTANASLGKPASPSEAGQSMYRIYNLDLIKMLNTDDNFVDFDLTASPTAGSIPKADVVEVDPEVATYPALELSELLPDPASPLTDATDEYIEIYNPSANTVDLSGWKLRDESGDEYLIKNIQIDPLEHLAIYVSDSKITLNNTGDSVVLIDPNGKVVDETANYGNAEVGLSWIKIANQWQWAEASTPGGINSSVYIEPITTPSAAVKSVKKAVAKKVASTVSAKTTTAKATKAKAASASSAKNSDGNGIDSQQSQSQGSKWWSWLLVSAGIATIGYGIYEYRTEINLFFKKLGSYFRSRPKVG